MTNKLFEGNKKYWKVAVKRFFLWNIMLVLTSYILGDALYFYSKNAAHKKGETTVIYEIKCPRESYSRVDTRQYIRKALR